MVDENRGPAGIDVSTPNVARMYDYYLGGKDNYAADREAAESVLAVAPEARALARNSRAFLGRAVRVLTEAGVRQFLDIGAGLPTQENVHEVAQRVNPDARVVYVDNDPVVVAHGRALLATDAATAMVNGDMRRPESLVADPDVRTMIDFGEPVAVLFVSALHCLADEDRPWDVATCFHDAMVSDSYLVISHITAEDHVEAAEEGAKIYRDVRATTPMTLRSREQIAAFFTGFEVMEPGLVGPSQWRPDAAPDRELPEDVASLTADKLPTWFLCGVGRKV